MPKSAFEQRIDELIAERQAATGERFTSNRLAEDAGIRGQTLKNWLAKAKAGKRPGKLELVAKLAAHYGRTVDWLYSTPDRPPEASIGDTAALAAEAAEALAIVDRIPVATAWELMRGVTMPEPTALRYFMHAYRKRRRAGSAVTVDLERALSGDAEQFRQGAKAVSPGRTGKQRK